MGMFVAADIGGTHVRAALYEADNPKPIAHQRADTRADEPGAYARNGHDNGHGHGHGHDH